MARSMDRIRNTLFSTIVEEEESAFRRIYQHKRDPNCSCAAVRVCAEERHDVRIHGRSASDMGGWRPSPRWNFYSHIHVGAKIAVVG